MSEKLMREVDRTKAELDAEDEREARRDERHREIDAMPETIEWPFWCRRCAKDVKAEGRKVTIPYAIPVAVYDARCPKGHHVRRQITDRADDPYFMVSRNVRRDRGENFDAIIQPHEEGFRTRYGDPNRKYEEAIERAERAAYGRR